MIISRARVSDFLKATKGKFFTLKFVKADGSIRVMNARVGVKRYVKGTGAGIDPMNKHVCVWDAQKKEYRNVNLETIFEITFKGETHLVKTLGVDYTRVHEAGE